MMDKATYRGEAAPTGNVQPLTTTSGKPWKHRLPILSGRSIALREVRLSDAPSLVAVLTRDEVTRFMSPPPGSLEGFERFVKWSHRQRAAGGCACFAVTLKGSDAAIGMFQVLRTDGDRDIAEWGFVLASPVWGSGVFEQAAALVVEFAFTVMNVNRLEARAAVQNGRGIAALRKTGAIEEGVLRKSLLRGGQYLDQALFAIVRDDWRFPQRSQHAGHSSVH
jgi:ribosomal-protein-alanine N-acetyltransferase